MNMKKNLPIYEVLFSPEDAGIYAVSLVSEPAIDVDFVFMSEIKEKVGIKMANEEKHLCTGPLLIPNQLIYRHDLETGEEYYIRYSEETIRMGAEKFMDNGFQANTDLEHNMDYSDKNILVEMWIIEDPECDKAKALGFDLPKGTLMATYKINDEAYWEEVKSGNAKGFSIEALAQFIPSGIAQSKNNNKINYTKKMSFIEKLKTLIQAEEAVEAVYTDVDGKEIRVDAEGICIRENAILEAGEYLLGDGRTLVVADGGKIVEVKEAAEAKVPEAETPAEAPIPIIHAADEEKQKTTEEEIPSKGTNEAEPVPSADEIPAPTDRVEESCEKKKVRMEDEEILALVAGLKAEIDALKAALEEIKGVPSAAPIQQSKTIDAKMGSIDRIKLIQSLYNN